MKIHLRNYPGSWNGDNCYGLGLGLSIGKRLGHDNQLLPTISGVSFSLGYFFGVLRLRIGLPTYRKILPDLKFLKLERLK